MRLGKTHISFETAKIGSLVDVQSSEDPEGLRVFYYLIQDLRVCMTMQRRCGANLLVRLQMFVFSLISLHFKIKPVSCCLHLCMRSVTDTAHTVDTIGLVKWADAGYQARRSAVISYGSPVRAVWRAEIAVEVMLCQAGGA